MPEFKKTQRQEQLTPVADGYEEKDRHGKTFEAERLPVGQRRDFMPRVKRKYPEQPR
jgi:hypothetical protein